MELRAYARAKDELEHYDEESGDELSSGPMMETAIAITKRKARQSRIQLTGEDADGS